MRHIGYLQAQAQAHTFGDFLVAKGIRNEIETEADGSSLIWIVEDDQLAEAQALLEKFRANPGGVEYREANALAARTRKAEAREKAEYQSRVRTRKSLFPAFGVYGVGILTYALIGICVAVAFYSKFGENENLVRLFFISDSLKATHGFLPDVFQQGEFWRLLTPVFLHFGPMHLFFDMMMLYVLGCMIEARQGSLQLLLLVLATGIFPT